MPSNEAPYMAVQALTNGAEDNFHRFFEHWLVEQNNHLEDLVSTTKNIDDDRRRHLNGGDVILRQKIARVVDHYDQYYRAKSRWAKHDALLMFAPTWRSSLEDAFLWIGGWRPTMAFHLLYSKSGLQFQDRLADLIQGLSTGDLADLSAAQLNQVM